MAGGGFPPYRFSTDMYGCPTLAAVPPLPLDFRAPPSLHELRHLAGGKAGLVECPSVVGDSTGFESQGGGMIARNYLSLPPPPPPPPLYTESVIFAGVQPGFGGNSGGRPNEAIARELEEPGNNLEHHGGRKEGEVEFEESKITKIVHEPESSNGLKNDNPVDESGLQDNIGVVHTNPSDNAVQLTCSRTDPADTLSEVSFYSDSSKEEVEEPKSRKRKRNPSKKLVDFFGRLMNLMMERQGAMERQIMEMIEKMEKDRLDREESWRKQQMEVIKRDMEQRAEERSLAISRHLALISFIEKITGQKFEISKSLSEISTGEIYLDTETELDRKENVSYPGSNRWPEPEVLALVRLRSAMEHKFQNRSLKGPLWEDISGTMSSLGYNRSAKKCKEKWENINKYFKRTVGRNKKRAKNSKTCPYFHELETLYRRGFFELGNLNEKSDDDRELHIVWESTKEAVDPLAICFPDMLGTCKEMNCN